ncbi:MAG: hypothetical protein C5B44_02540 [Acidobacteria bacterium]|nr:MAG: hypothetical protein C5B44_02540 [Acidobacteriota bacterium]
MNLNNIEIRLASPADAESIAGVLYAAFVEYQRLYTAEGFRVTVSDASMVRDRINEGPVWVALLDQLIVGTAGAVAHGDSLYIRGMAVLPSARDNGVGQKLLKHIEKYARSQSFERMFLSTTPFLDRAIALYEHFGFRRADYGPSHLFETPLFTMEKSLKDEPAKP